MWDSTAERRAQHRSTSTRPDVRRHSVIRLLAYQRTDHPRANDPNTWEDTHTDEPMTSEGVSLAMDGPSAPFSLEHSGGKARFHQPSFRHECRTDPHQSHHPASPSSPTAAKDFDLMITQPVSGTKIRVCDMNRMRRTRQPHCELRLRLASGAARWNSWK